ncbi:hypothetical protein LguiA_006666 [Lonicera macranthoides]
MLFGNVSSHKTHYGILGVEEDASCEEIRTSYRSAILNSHPDKLQKKAETSNSGHNDRFLEIQRAWEILGSSKSRALYDSELRALRQDDAVTAEEVGLEDLTVEDGGDDDVVELLYWCRCGDYFSINSVELGEMGYLVLRDGSKISLKQQGDLPASVVLPCGSCSLTVRLLINADVWLQNDDHL